MRSISGVCTLVLLLVAVGCGGGGSSYSSTPTSPTTTTTTTTSTTNAVIITITSQNGTQSFSPNPASAGGQMVAFKNADSVTHRVVLNDASIDTGDIAPGATSRAVQMPSAGTNYHCSIHTTMVGAIAGTSGETPTCQGPYCSDGGYY